jgi:hypothetical protein
MAKELAGVFYESNRSPGFRKAFPNFKNFMRGQWHQADGSIKLYRPGWLHFVALARKRMATILGDKAVHPHIKEAIFNALIEDRNRQFKAETTAPKTVKELFQSGMRTDG